MAQRKKAQQAANRVDERGARYSMEDDTKPACAIQGCIKPLRARGYCTAHYNHLRNLGEFGQDLIQDKCKLIDCEGYGIVQGYCSKHYRRITRHGNPHTVMQPSNKKERGDGIPRRKGLEKYELESLGINFSEYDLW